MNFNNEANARLKQFRQETGLKQKDFAEKIGVNLSYYSDVENNRRKVTAGLLEKIKAHFNISNDWVFYGEENTPNNTLSDVPASVRLEAIKQKLRRSGKTKFDQLSEEEMNELYDAVHETIKSDDLRKIEARPNDSKLFFKRFMYDKVLTDERQDLGNIDYELSSIEANTHLLMNIYDTYLSSWGKEPKAESYTEYKKKKIKQLEKNSQYLDVIKSLNKNLDIFFREFKKFDNKGIIEYLD